jgi:pilus assembly protein CpaB
LVTAVQDATGTISDGDKSDETNNGGALKSNKNSSQNEGYLVTLARSDAEVEKIVYTAEFGTIYLSKEPSSSTEGTSGVLDRGRLFQ